MRVLEHKKEKNVIDFKNPIKKKVTSITTLV